MNDLKNIFFRLKNKKSERKGTNHTKKCSTEILKSERNHERKTKLKIQGG